MKNDPNKIGVLFVCLGNICRSPIAHGYFEDLVSKKGLAEKFSVDSAGTSGFHRGEPPDPGSLKICRDHGLSIDHQRSRRIQSKDLVEYDFIIAMDESNKRDLFNMNGGANPAIFKMRDFDPGHQGADVPDPYGGGLDGFRNVYQMIERSSVELLNHILDNHNP